MHIPVGSAGDGRMRAGGASATSLDAAAIFAHARLAACLRRQAATLVALHSANPRISSTFATQQRWLLGHVALALYFRNLGDPNGAAAPVLSRFLDIVEAEGIASRNTADAFFKEMEKYGYLQIVAGAKDRRTRPFEAAPFSLQMIGAWLTVHLATLDGLDDGDRGARYQARPDALAAIHPRIADRLLACEIIRAPTPTFSLFTWLNEGGIVMDWLFAGLADVVEAGGRIPSSVTSYAEIGELINLSLTHLTRKLRQAEEMGSLGWLGARGKSTMWVSTAFRDEYYTQQAVKLAAIDAAFGETAAAGEI